MVDLFLCPSLNCVSLWLTRFLQLCYSKTWHQIMQMKKKKIRSVCIIWGQFWNSDFFFVNFFLQMLYCQVCCEPFHQFCLEPEDRPSEENKENWCCRRCKFCHVCGRKNKHSKVRPAILTCFVTFYLLRSIIVVQSVSITFFLSPSAVVGVWTMSELLSYFVSGSQLSKAKQEEESLGRFHVS